MKHYVLNLPEDTERLAAFRAGYPECLPPCEVWPGKTAEEIVVPDWWKTSPRFASHRQNFIDMMAACIADDEDYFIFEDDCLFAETFAADYAAFMAEVPTDWDLLNFLTRHAQNGFYWPRQISEHVLRPAYGYATSAIMVTPRGAARIKEILEREPWGCAHIAERQIALLYLDPEFRVYSPVENFTGQRGGWSTLCQCERGELWFNDFRYINLDGEMVVKEQTDG